MQYNEIINQGREWLSTLTWYEIEDHIDDKEEYFSSMSCLDIFTAIENLYDGGVLWFLMDHEIIKAGEIVVNIGRRKFATITDVKTFYTLHNIKSKPSEQYPYNLNIKGLGLKQCETITECLASLEKYAISC